jgi:hypothetical protein
MALPPLYKYLDVDGAKKTLGNKCFRFSKPSEYKDLEDMTAGSLFPDELEVALAILSDGFVDVIVENPNAALTCSEKLRPKVVELQKKSSSKSPTISKSSTARCGGTVPKMSRDAARRPSLKQRVQVSRRINAGW